MAKKKHKIVKRRKPAAHADEPEQLEDVEVPVPASPGIPRIMVTWHGTGSSERESKNWYGLTFDAGKPVSVEQSPFWNAMRNDIDRAAATGGGGEWSYEHVIEHPEPEPPPPEPEPEPEAESYGRSRR